MAAQITASSKGQVVLPKRVRDRLGIASGTRLDVIDTPTGVELRPVAKAKTLSIDEALERLGQVVKYTGPPRSEADWPRGIDKLIKAKWAERLE